MMIRKPVLQQMLRECSISLMWFALAYLALILIVNVFTATVGGTNYNIITVDFFGSHYYSGIVGGSFIWLMCFWFFFTGIEGFTDDIHFYMQHGVSRKATFTGVSTSILISAVLASVLAIVISGLEILMANLFLRHGNTGEFTTFYGDWFEQVGTVVGLLALFLWYLAFLFSIGVIGYFSATTYYRLSKFGRIIVGVSIGSAIIVLIPTINRLTDGRFLREFFETVIRIFIEGNPIYGILYFLAVSLMFSGFTWLILRRCPLKKM